MNIFESVSYYWLYLTHLSFCYLLAVVLFGAGVMAHRAITGRGRYYEITRLWLGLKLPHKIGVGFGYFLLLLCLVLLSHHFTKNKMIEELQQQHSAHCGSLSFAFPKVNCKRVERYLERLEAVEKKENLFLIDDEF